MPCAAYALGLFRLIPGNGLNIFIELLNAVASFAAKLHNFVAIIKLQAARFGQLLRLKVGAANYFNPRAETSSSPILASFSDASLIFRSFPLISVFAAISLYTRSQSSTVMP